MSRNASVPSALFEAVRSVITTAELPWLGPGPRPNVKSSNDLQRELRPIFDQSDASPTAQSLLRTAALVWHDHLDEAHGIVQDGRSTEEAFLHGIIHRREPDFSNAKYWFHRVGRHGSFAKLAARVTEFLSDKQIILDPALVENGVWQPMNFIDACDHASRQPTDKSRVGLLQQVQRIEFDTLLEHLCLSVRRDN